MVYLLLWLIVILPADQLVEIQKPEDFVLIEGF